MNLPLVLILISFWLMAGWNFYSESIRGQALSRSRTQWFIDIIGLCIHGTVVPLFQTFVVFALLTWLLPEGKGLLKIPAFLSFLINFVLIDYLYYWNHRYLHSKLLWRFHSLHHSGNGFDVFTTSRNSAVTTFFILYIWVNGFLLYLLNDPAPFAWAVLFSNILDIFRHSRIPVSHRFPFNILITPQDHAWHHSRHVHGANFGGNFNLWDKLHGTYYASKEFPQEFGILIEDRDLWRSFWKGNP